MNAEVIDILSSSPEPFQRPPPSAQVVRQPFLPDSSKPIKPSGSFRDVFDLTSDPPEACRSSPKPTQSTLPPPKRTVSPVAFYEPDDFDTTGDFDDSQTIGRSLSQSTRNAKRIRLSPSGDLHNKPSSLDSSRSNLDKAAKPPIQLAGGAVRKIMTTEDPIEFSSSPALPLKTKAPSNMSILRGEDPFASTPPAPTRVPEPAPPKPISSFEDPFASTPARNLEVTNGKSQVFVDLANSDEDLGGTTTRGGNGRPALADKLGCNALENALNGRPRSPKKPANWDPISSSAPEPQRGELFSLSSSPPRPRRNKGKAPAVIDLDDSDHPATTTHTTHKPQDEYHSDDSFPDINDMDITRFQRKPPPPLPRTDRVFSRTQSENTTRTAPRPKAAPKPVAKKSAEERAVEKETKAVEREREKERKRVEKETAKEQKAREKERAAAMAEVNKIRTDKKVSTPEMIADLPASLPEALALQVQTLLKDLDVVQDTWQSPVENVIKWRRKVKSCFNDEIGLWEPCPLRIEAEKYALAYITADELVTMVLAPEAENLDAYAANMKSHFADHQLLYLIEGIGPWMRKNRNLRNRQFVSAVRATDASESAPGPSSQSNGRRRKARPQKEYVDEDVIEDALLSLQVLHGAFIHHTNAAIESAQWVAVFTQHISTVPYRRQKEEANAAGAGFCIESGQVRTGEDKADTYARMLQEIVRVTAPIAYGIAAEYPSVSSLVKGMEERGPLALEACPRSLNRDGAVADRTVGQAISRRMHKVFTGRDETSTDI